jgi:hypothetical protein
MSPKMPKKNDQDYYAWLISQIEVPEGRTFYDLFERMHNTEFIWIVPNDDNRLHDGLDLRTEFLRGTHGLPSEEILKLRIMTGKGASFLEVLIALSRKAAFICDGDAPYWAFHLMENIGLDKLSDPMNDRKSQRAEEIFERVIWRTYEHNGEGGFFPLNFANEDQRKVELWYQLNKYAMEIQS